MKRRSFIGSLLAMITAVFALPRIPKPEPDLVQVDFVTGDMATHMIGSANEPLEIGDHVYLGEDGKVRKWRPGSKNPAIGWVQKTEFNFDNNSEITFGGM